jgi:excisionase family DNA binding protein
MTPRVAAAAKDMDREWPNWKLSYRTDEAAAATGLSERTIKRRIADSSIQARKDGRATIIMADDLKAFLASRPRHQPGPRP